MKQITKQTALYTGVASLATLAAVNVAAGRSAHAQGAPGGRPQRDPAQRQPGGDFFGPGGPPRFGPGGPGGRGGPFAQQQKILKQFDKDGTGWLNNAERKAARAFLQQSQANGQGGPGFGPPRGFGGRGNQEPARPGPRVSMSDAKSYPTASLYEPTVLRTFFLEFENADWEKELAEFRNTDVEVPATLTVDGKKYPNVGVRFRGASSYFMVSEGYKRSLNISVDMADSKQRVYGHRTLNLLNSNGDPTFMRAAIYSHIARKYLPAPRANLAKVVINGESWGIYGNAEQFNKDFVKEHFSNAKGIRWKVPGNPGGGGGLIYQGEDPEAYKRQYEIKTDDPKEAALGWKELIALCRTLEQTPPARLEQALESILNVDGALRFLAVENVLINSDGYWTRASDFSLYRDENGKLHVIPHDMNEGMEPAGGGPGGPGGPGGFRAGGPGGPGGFGPGGPGGFGPGGPGGPGGFGGPRGQGGPGGPGAGQRPQLGRAPGGPRPGQGGFGPGVPGGAG
ncbi:MAG: CotH kinase family protein, partial [Actinomycetota bacterium]